MSDKAAKTRHVKHSEKMDRLQRLNKDFAIKPFAHDNERWDSLRIAGGPVLMKKMKEHEHKRMIKEVQQGVKGLEFPAEEMAKIIRGWMAQDDK
jgi:hypothetical protein